MMVFQISTPAMAFEWIKTIAVPMLFPEYHYNGNRMSGYDRTFTDDMVDLRLGPLMLRQFRVKPGMSMRIDMGMRQDKVNFPGCHFIHDGKGGWFPHYSTDHQGIDISLFQLLARTNGLTNSRVCPLFEAPRRSDDVCIIHEDVIRWKHFPRYWSFVRGIHRFTVDSPHKGQWCRALMVSLIRAWQTVEQTIETPVIWNAIAAHHDVIEM